MSPSDGSAPPRLAVIAEGPVVEAGLRAVLTGRAQVRAHGGTDPPAELLDDVDAVLTDPAHFGAADWEALTEAARAADVPVVAYVSHFDQRLVNDAVSGRLRGILLRRASPVALLDALERAIRGEFVIDPGLSAQLAASAIDLRAARSPDAGHGLTPREREILVALGRGLGNDEISDRLSISVQTVRTHLRAIYRKLGVHDRAGAVATAWRLGLVVQAPGR